MQFAIVIAHEKDKATIRAVAPAHRVYLRGLLSSGRLIAAGPMADDAGALWICDAETAEQAEEIIRGDPSAAAGVFIHWHVYPLAYWSAKAFKAGLAQSDRTASPRQGSP